MERSIEAIDWLAGSSGEGCSPTPIQHQCLSALRAEVLEDRPPPDLRQQEALTALLLTDARYLGGDDGTGTIAPFGSATLSLPEAAEFRPKLVDLLGSDDAALFERVDEHLVLSASEYAQHVAEHGEAPVYLDPILKKQGQYAELVCDLKRRGLVAFTKKPREEVGLF